MLRIVLVPFAFLLVTTAHAAPRPDPISVQPSRDVSGKMTPSLGGLSATQQKAVLKAQQASEARDKAWDAKLKRTMDGVCRGC